MIQDAVYLYNLLFQDIIGYVFSEDFRLFHESYDGAADELYTIMVKTLRVDDRIPKQEKLL